MNFLFKAIIGSTFGLIGGLINGLLELRKKEDDGVDS